MTQLERQPPMPIEPGRCNECGHETQLGLVYCNSDCSRKYSNRLNGQGKSMMQMLKVWRKHRGRKGSPGEGVMAEICHRLDSILASDRARWAENEKKAEQ